MQVTRGSGGPLATAMRGLASGDVPWGPGHHERFRRRFDHTMQVLAACEDLPEEHNRVTLDPALTDSDGIPAPKLTYRLSENSRRMLAHGLERGREPRRAAGAAESLETPLLRAGGWQDRTSTRLNSSP